MTPAHFFALALAVQVEANLQEQLSDHLHFKKLMKLMKQETSGT